MKYDKTFQEAVEAMFSGKGAVREDGYKHRWSGVRFECEEMLAGTWCVCELDELDYISMWRIVEKPVSSKAVATGLYNVIVSGSSGTTVTSEGRGRIDHADLIPGKTYIVTEKPDA